MSKVIQFPEPEADGVIEILEEAILRARRGQYSAICIVNVDREGATGGAHSLLHNRATMIGAMMLEIHGMMDD